MKPQYEAVLKRIQKKEGDVFIVPITDTQHCYAVALNHPLFGFFDVLSDTEHSVSSIDRYDVLFAVWVMDYAVKKGRWRKLGHTEKFKGCFEGTRFFKQDTINGRLTSYCDTDGSEFPISYNEAIGLEAAAVWDPEHVEQRLRDHFAGVPNKWVEIMKLKSSPHSHS
ncbi:Imm26 family immunity protein [Mesorhizobium denitrificans]|nr:Imm26 family immunity protein [Mesorhizobium denitrificans]